MSSVEELSKQILSGDRASLARGITLVESSKKEHRKQAEELLDSLNAHNKNTKRFGISGVPGVGKSTLIETLGLYAIANGERVAVLAIDPSSSISGGSILGDKTRMQKLSQAEEAFIRPSPSNLHLGGVSARTRDAITLVEAAGFTTIIIETVGVGQSEIEVSQMVDMFILLLLPGSGDELQGIKKGIVEISDLLAITKADGDLLAQAKRVEADYAAALRLLPERPHGQIPKATTVSAISGDGISKMWDEMVSFIKAIQENGYFHTNRTRQNISGMRALFNHLIFAELEEQPSFIAARKKLEEKVANREISASAAARQLVLACDLF